MARPRRQSRLWIAHDVRMGASPIAIGVCTPFLKVMGPHDGVKPPRRQSHVWIAHVIRARANRPRRPSKIKLIGYQLRSTE